MYVLSTLSPYRQSTMPRLERKDHDIKPQRAKINKSEFQITSNVKEMRMRIDQELIVESLYKADLL